MFIIKAMETSETGNQGNDESGQINNQSRESYDTRVPSGVWQHMVQGMIQAQEQNKQLLQILIKKRQPSGQTTETAKPGGVKDFKSLYPLKFSGSGGPIIAKK